MEPNPTLLGSPPVSAPFALAPRSAPQIPAASGSPYPPWLDELLRARPQPIVIVGILFASLVAGMVVAFVITKIVS